MLAVITGPVRSGKSRAGVQLALSSGLPVVLVVGGAPDDEEMARRIERHRAGRSGDITVIEAADDPSWHLRVPAGSCLLVDCLGTVLGGPMAGLVPEGAELLAEGVEAQAETAADWLVSWLVARDEPTVVVTNEVGWGVVPPSPLGRLFRDVVGRANRVLVDAADAAWLVVAGHALPLRALSQEVSWPEKG
jgi:adenosylcobinamide kinase/adenosylcobinamide-phosphate guanylyltransferase